MRAPIPRLGTIGETEREKMEHFVLGVDLDGVVGDYESAFRGFVAEKLGVTPSQLPPAVDWDLSKCGWGIRDLAHFQALHGEAVGERGLFRTMPVIEGASEMLHHLSENGVWIRIITHRLVVNFAHAAAVSDTVNWLDDHRIPYRDICFIGDKPKVGADLYVDDAPHNIQKLRASGAEAVIFTQDYNQHLEGLRVGSWEELAELVLSRAEQASERELQQPR